MPANATNAALNILLNIWVTSIILRRIAPIASEASSPSPQNRSGRADGQPLEKIGNAGIPHADAACQPRRLARERRGKTKAQACSYHRARYKRERELSQPDIVCVLRRP
jgi:hypothetical protein